MKTCESAFQSCCRNPRPKLYFYQKHQKRSFHSFLFIEVEIWAEKRRVLGSNPSMDNGHRRYSLLGEGGARTPSEHRQDTLELGAEPELKRFSDINN